MKLFKRDEKKEYEKNSGSSRFTERHTQILNKRKFLRGIRQEEENDTPDYDDFDYIPSTVEDDTYLHLGNYPKAYEEVERRPDSGGKYMADDELKGYLDRWTLHGKEDQKFDDIYQTVAGMKINFRISRKDEEPEAVEIEDKTKPDPDPEDYAAGFEQRIKPLEATQDAGKEAEGEAPEYESEEWRAQYSQTQTNKSKKFKRPKKAKVNKTRKKLKFGKKTLSSKEIRQKRRRKRRRVKTSFIVLLILILAAVLGFVGIIEADKHGAFNVDTVLVEGLNHYTEYDIIKAADAQTGVSLLTLKTMPMKEKIVKLPYVETATISKKFPKTLILTVEERVPFYAIYYGGAYTLVDEEFTTLERSNDAGNYPILEGYVPAATPEPGKLFECKDEYSFKTTMQMVESLRDAGLNFYKIICKNGIINIYITKSILVEGSYENISNYIKEINEILYMQSLQGIERGTVHVGDNGYISFSPMI